MNSNLKKFDKVSLLTALKFSPTVVMDIILGTIALNVLALALPLTLMQVYDRIIAQHALGTLFVLSTACGLAIFLETIVHIARDRVSSWCGSRFEFEGVRLGFDHLLHSPISNLEGENTIDRLEELNAFSALKSTYFLRSIQTLIDVPFAFGNLALAYFLAPKVAYFLAALLIAIILIHLALMAAVYFRKKNAQSANIRRDKKVLETFRYINTIRALTLEESVLRRVEKEQERMADLNLKSINLTAISSSILQVTPQVAIFGVLLVGAEDVLTHSITVGLLTTCMMLAGRCLAPVLALVSGWLHLEEKNKQEVYANKLLTLQSDNWKEEEESFPPIQGEIKIENLSFSHKKGSEPIISDVSFTIPAKAMLGINSNYDFASSIFTDLLMRNLSPSMGSISFDTQRMEDIPVKYFYRDVQCLTNEPVFFRGTILENLASFDVNLYDEAIEKSKSLGLEDAIAGFELGYTSMMDRENILATSTSLLMRMSILRAVIKKPRVLIINGVDHGMDMDSKKLFTKVLRFLKNKCTVLCITNDPAVLSMCDKVLYLRHGQFSENEGVDS